MGQGDVFVQGEAFELIVEAEKDKELQIPEMDERNLESEYSSQTSIINGNISKAHRWIFTILPNQAGVLRIPPFQLGNEQTEEIQLDIADRKSHQMALPIEIAARVEPRQVYPQQQQVLEIRLERGIPVENESLTPPDLPNIPFKLLEQQNEQQVRNGRRLNVTTLRYAIFPQESGTLNPYLSGRGDSSFQRTKPISRSESASRGKNSASSIANAFSTSPSYPGPKRCKRMVAASSGNCAPRTMGSQPTCLSCWGFSF